MAWRRPGAASRGGHGAAATGDGVARGAQRGRGSSARQRPEAARGAVGGGGGGRGAAMARRHSPVGAPAAGTVKDGEGRVRFECVDPMVGNSCMNLKHRKLCWEKTSGRCIGFPVTAARRTHEPEKESRSPYEKALVTAHGYGP